MAKKASIGAMANKVVSTAKKYNPKGTKGAITSSTGQNFSASDSKKNSARLRQDMNKVKKGGGGKSAQSAFDKARKSYYGLK